MRIEEEIKLDYSDVLFRPKRSTLKSRKEVDLNRTYKFKYSNNEWTGIPIIASNMDGVGEINVAKSLAKGGQTSKQVYRNWQSFLFVYSFRSLCGKQEQRVEQDLYLKARSGIKYG